MRSSQCRIRFEFTCVHGCLSLCMHVASLDGVQGECTETGGGPWNRLGRERKERRGLCSMHGPDLQDASRVAGSG